jgi:PIN domain nuclease of toxin-antitoxin system
MGTVIDASALIAFLRYEPGAGAVENVIDLPQTCYVHALNLCQVYYDFWRASNQNAEEAAITDLVGLRIGAG